MGAIQKIPLRALTDQEQQSLERVVKARSERVDVVRKAQALAIDPSAGQRFIQATPAMGKRERLGQHNGRMIRGGHQVYRALAGQHTRSPTVSN